MQQELERRARQQQNNRRNRERHGEKFNAARRAKYAADPNHRAVLAARAKARREKDAEKKRAYQAAYWARNRESLLAQGRLWREANPEKVCANNKRWRSENLERSKAYIAAWRLAHPNYRTKRYASDPEFMITVRLRERLRAVVRRASANRAGGFHELLGCDVATLATHIESQFLSGMTWANYPEWHVDHIRPCVTFDLTDPEQQRACFHFTNLRPLWAGDNLARPRSRWTELELAA